MEFRVRPFNDSDVAAAIAISDAIYPEYRKAGWHAAEQFESARVTPYRYVADAQRQIGYAAIRYLRQRQARIDLMVHPKWQRRGAGAELLDRLLKDLISLNSPAAHARVREDHEEGLAFLRHRRFVEHQRMYGLKLDVPRADISLLWPIVRRLQSEGIQITTFVNERAVDPSFTNKLLDLHNAALPTWPDPELVSFHPVARDDFALRLEREAGSQADALFIARTERIYVGYSGLFALGTAVRPEFRGRGIATALKCHTIKYAQEKRMQSAITCTANPAMLSINEKLGYQRQFVEIRMMKALSSDP